MTFIRTYPPAQPRTGATIWLPFRNSELLVAVADTGVKLMESDALPAVWEAQPLVYLGDAAGVPCVACELAVDAPLPEGWRAINLRVAFDALTTAEFELALYAWPLLEWQRTGRFCPNCGAGLYAVDGDWGRRCAVCRHTIYPPVSPAILVLIHKADEVLLTHKPGWGARYSIIAGFVEPGESLEGCVAREALEEVGVHVDQIEYVGSQPWPFPHNVMIGFMARYVSGEIVLDVNELDDARWFHVDALPELPGPISLSRQIIDRWQQRV
jgi:NAD+ diphosphatase